jgi:glutathione peroxidase
VSFTQLQQLQKQYEADGFSVLAFPSNDYHQELASNEDIAAFIEEHYPGRSLRIA